MLTEKINRPMEYSAHGPEFVTVKKTEAMKASLMKRNQSWRKSVLGRGAASTKSWSSNRLLSLKHKRKANTARRSEKVRARTRAEVE